MTMEPDSKTCMGVAKWLLCWVKQKFRRKQVLAAPALVTPAGKFNTSVGNPAWSNNWFTCSSKWLLPGLACMLVEL